MQNHEIKANNAHLRLVRGIKDQIREIDREMESVARQQQEVANAQEALEQIETLLLRMSMLAREAAAGRMRPGLSDEFDALKRSVLELSGGIELSQESRDALKELSGQTWLTE